jgi:hypothetical protein
MPFDDAAEVPDWCSGLHKLDCFVETFPCRFDDSDCVWICFGSVTDVVCFVKISVIAAVVDGYVEIEDIAVEENSLVWDAVTDYFIW